MSTKLHKINNDSVVVFDFMFERIKSMQDIGETQFKNFVSVRLIFGKKPISADIHKQAKRSCFQSGYLWVEATEDIPLPDASPWGWIFN